MTDQAAPDRAPLLVLHVCTGNICRSPMAELLMRHELDVRYGPAADRVVLDGAGTYDGHVGRPINPPAGEALRAFGVGSDDFRAQALGAAAVRRAGLVLCASREHARRVVTLVPEAADRTFTLLDLAELAERGGPELPGTADPAVRLTALRELAGSRLRRPSPDSDIDDPYGLSPAVYERTARLIQDAVRAVVGSPSASAAPASGEDHVS